MDTSISTPEDICSVPQTSDKFDEAIKLVGDFWTLRIVDSLRSSELRFCEIERALAHSNPSTLTTRLKRLEESGVIERRIETRDKQSVTYVLTPKGQAIVPVLEAIKAFTESAV